MELNRKIKKPILKKVISTNLPQKLEPEIKIIEAPKPALEAKLKLEENNNKSEYDSNYYYTPFLDNPPVQSVGNSGWQVSDIWREIRVDNYCDSW